MIEKQTPPFIQQHVNIRHLSTFKTGGTAAFFAEINTIERLKEAIQFAIREHVPFIIIGGGSNILLPDDEYKGLIIHLVLRNLIIDKEHEMVTAQAGVPLARVVKETIRNGFQGFEWAAGVPGSVGGAIRGNAGCFGGETKDHLVEVEVLKVANEGIIQKTIKAEEMNMQYRSSFIKKDPSYIVLSGTWKLRKGNEEQLRQIFDEHMETKRQTQPAGKQCAGSFFKGIEVKTLTKEARERIKQYECFIKNGILPASLLIDKELHMKGYVIGDAQVSEKHAGYIINNGNATSQDIEGVAKEIEKRMNEQLGIQLEREVEVIS